MHRQNIDGVCIYYNFGQNLHKFSEARHHRADKNSKIIAIEPMNRKAGSSISRDKSAAKANREKQLRSKSCRFRAMRPSGEFP
jgi:hypothetical protein